MLISPPMLRAKNSMESDAEWVARMIPIDPQRGFPINRAQAWHGGVHLLHSDSGSVAETIRAMADGKVLSVREPVTPEEASKPPYNYNGRTDRGYVLLKHETEIGGGTQGKVVFYSLYMHLNFISKGIVKDAKVYRKDPLGTVGQIDGKNGIHLQIFCDDANQAKLVGRTTKELDISQDGRKDIVYGDIHFYLPVGTKFYAQRPDNNSPTPKESEIYTSIEPLYVTMHFEQGSCSMTTRRKASLPHPGYANIGEALVDVDNAKYEYNLYDQAQKLDPQSPSAGYELLRFGRIINTEHETLVPTNAPLWRTVNFPEGKGFVNLAANEIKKFSDGDFPHWAGWTLIDDDTDNNSQWNSPTLFAMNGEDLSRTICHFPLEWDEKTVETRYGWLKSKVMSDKLTELQRLLLLDTGLFDNIPSPYSFHRQAEIPQKLLLDSELLNNMPVMPDISTDMPELNKPTPSYAERDIKQVWLADKEWDNLIAHIKSLCFNTEELGLPTGRVWHYEPRQFINHFRKCLWLSKNEFKQTIPSYAMRRVGQNYRWEAIQVNEAENSVFSRHYTQLNIAMRKYCINTPWRMACFLGNANQETQWLSKTKEGYRYSRINAKTKQKEFYNIWYYPWYGRGFLQLTNPANYFEYFTFRSHQYSEEIRDPLVRSYRRLQGNIRLREGDTSLYDENNPLLTPEIINWREQVASGALEPADSAGFYWCKTDMAKYADKEHILERHVITTNVGNMVYYRSQAFWQASATVNLPSRVNDPEYQGLNGFDARCCAYGNIIATLTEVKFPDVHNNLTAEIPESNQLRRK